MKPKILKALILLIIPALSQAQTVDTLELANAKKKLEQTNTRTHQYNYFEIFPGSFNEFQETFGFENDKRSPLYDGYEFIELFFSLDSISDSERMNKYIAIALGGSWEADAVNYFQHNLKEYTLDRAELLHSTLISRSDQEIESFFTFYFDGVHEYKGDIPREFEFLATTDIGFYNIVSACHKRSSGQN